MILHSLRSFLSTCLLLTGYTACLLQWAWTALIGIPPLIESGVLDTLLTASSSSQPAVRVPVVTSSAATWIIVGIITLVVLIATIVILLRLPKTILHTGEELVGRASQTVMPLITHHTVFLPPKKRQQLSRRVRLAIQLLAVILPLFISLLLPAYEEITRQIGGVVAGSLAVISLTGFLGTWFITQGLKATSRTQSRASRGSR